MAIFNGVNACPEFLACNVMFHLYKYLYTLAFHAIWNMSMVDRNWAWKCIQWIFYSPIEFTVYCCFRWYILILHANSNSISNSTVYNWFYILFQNCIRVNTIQIPSIACRYTCTSLKCIPCSISATKYLKISCLCCKLLCTYHENQKHCQQCLFVHLW